MSGAVIVETESMLSQLAAWFSSQCDGDWEHSYGLSIETTDNPGWHVEVDLTETAWASLVVPFRRDERSGKDWVQFEVREGKFIGSGGVANLSEVLLRFLDLVKTGSHRARGQVQKLNP